MAKKAIRTTKRSAKIVKHGIKKTATEVRKHIITAISAAFAFVIALTWRDVIREGIDKLLQTLGVVGDGYTIKLIAAILVTMLCVLGIIFIARLGKKE